MDRKETNERAVERRPDQAARRTWVKPRLESAAIRTETRVGKGDGVDFGGGGAGRASPERLGRRSLRRARPERHA